MHAGAELVDEGIAIGVANVGGHHIPFGEHGGNSMNVEGQADRAGKEVHRAGGDDPERMTGLPCNGCSG